MGEIEKTLSESYGRSFIIIKSGLVTEIGDGFLELTGHPEDKLVGMPVHEIFISKLRATFDIFTILNEENSTADGFIFTKTLEVREITVCVDYISESGLNILKVSEKEDSRLDNKFPLVQEMLKHNLAGIGIFCVNPDIVLLKANQSYLDFFGHPYNLKENSIGKRIYEFVTGWKGSTSEVIWKNLLSTREPFNIDEYSFSWPDRGTCYYRGTLIPITENDAVKYVIETTTDITESVLSRKRIEEQGKIIEEQKKQLEVILNNMLEGQKQLLAAERAKNEALEKSIKMKDEFLATITHEFKTPLTVINAATQAINSLYAKELSPKVKQHIQRIRVNAFRQLRLVNNLLDITRYRAGHIKVQKQNLDLVFLTRSITNSVKPFAAQKEVNLVFTSEVESLIMAVDDEKYERILLNLLSNAIKFIPKGKEIQVHVECKDRNAVISVKDEGVGIPKEKQKLIFKRFGQVDSVLTRQAEGTGIGLSLVKSLVTALGGEITLESKVGKGSTFYVTLPATKTRRRKYSQRTVENQDNRIMQAVAIEFSDIYLD